MRDIQIYTYTLCSPYMLPHQLYLYQYYVRIYTGVQVNSRLSLRYYSCKSRVSLTVGRHIYIYAYGRYALRRHGAVGDCRGRGGVLPRVVCSLKMGV